MSLRARQDPGGWPLRHGPLPTRPTTSYAMLPSFRSLRLSMPRRTDDSSQPQRLVSHVQTSTKGSQCRTWRRLPCPFPSPSTSLLASALPTERFIIPRARSGTTKSRTGDWKRFTRIPIRHRSWHTCQGRAMTIRTSFKLAFLRCGWRDGCTQDLQVWGYRSRSKSAPRATLPTS